MDLTKTEIVNISNASVNTYFPTCFLYKYYSLRGEYVGTTNRYVVSNMLPSYNETLWDSVNSLLFLKD